MGEYFAWIQEPRVGELKYNQNYKSSTDLLEMLEKNLQLSNWKAAKIALYLRNCKLWNLIKGVPNDLERIQKALQNKKPAGSKLDQSHKAKKEVSGKDALFLKLMKKLKVKNPTVIKESLEKIEPGHSIGFNKSIDKLFEIPVGGLFEKIKDFQSTQFLVIDGILTGRLIALLVPMKIKFIACKNKEEDIRIPSDITIFFF